VIVVTALVVRAPNEAHDPKSDPTRESMLQRLIAELLRPMLLTRRREELRRGGG
jgi:hypothetical protein